METEPDRIRLSRVEIDNAGPIHSFRADLAPLTLVYAANERGKTTIVENLVACLFRRRKEGMQLRRDFIGSAKVTVQGLSDRPVVFNSLAGRKKLDDLIEAGGWAFPPSLFDLLVVKGAELEVLRQQGGVSRSYLKSLITMERLYETLRDRLPGEVGYTELKQGILLPKRRIGLYKSYEEVTSRLSSLKNTADTFYGSLSRTELLADLARKTSLIQEKQQLQLAKRHAAYRLHRSIRELEAELARFDDHQAERLADTFKDYLRTKAELAGVEEENQRLENTREDLRWLEEVRRRFDRSLEGRKNPPQLVSLLAAAASLTAGLAAYFFSPVLLPVFLIGAFLAVGLAVVFTFLLRTAVNPDSARAEIGEIKGAFKDRFGTPLSTPADFDLVKSRLDRELGKALAVEDRRGAAEADLDSLRAQIGGFLMAAGRSEVPESGWAELSRELRESCRQRRMDYDLSQRRLEDLGIEKIDYLDQPPPREYSRQREEEISRELEEVEEKIGEQRKRIQELREQLIEHIGADTARSENIETVAEVIEERRGEYQRQLRDCLAEMIAAHVVAGVLESLRSLEDRQLESTLNDTRITALIKMFTAGRYERVSLAGDGLSVENDSESYAMGDLSSGAREQALLALRMGLASIVCGKKGLFLILDDAFQYSDWQRRDALVAQAVRAVRSGWQVIYLSMDDDIRDRFCKAAEGLGKGIFKLIEL